VQDELINIEKERLKVDKQRLSIERQRFEVEKQRLEETTFFLLGPPNKGKNKITELRTILQRESQNS
jgi:hypothetical protein